MIDSDGFRPNVGIILANEAGQVLWARRINQEAWQFPQEASMIAKRRKRRCIAS